MAYPSFRLDGKVALIAGVGENMGLAIARAWRAGGVHLALTDLRPEPLAAAAGEVVAAGPGTGTVVDDAAAASWAPGDPPPGVVALTGDVREPADCARWVDTVTRIHGGLDILVCSVGRSSFGHALRMPAELFRQELESTVTGSFNVAQAAGRAMVASGRGGRIILFSSGAARKARKGGASHSAAKAAVNMLTKVLALELGEHDITVNAVAPGLVPRSGHVSTDDYRAAVRRSLPLGRLGRPEDVVAAATFLAAPESGWVTGEILHVDGGSGTGDAGAPAHTAAPRSVF
ncbi:SDR family oxidoreductase [Phytohabitans sp. ZYX-F-186]|uniref:SDR family oxidoreductase n=1 Tax=Phytohabitans maris TaxID=3071409 RepID=A0ABU0ZR23_9ACTN|nr:SDR family oxidoreductase [Phytohabitans sp. ZYX-F-186]MDQ7908912.1 SDR family oxidoreductase [Phytohabitans sp. ZYX-F-186]